MKCCLTPFPRAIYRVGDLRVGLWSAEASVTVVG